MIGRHKFEVDQGNKSPESGFSLEKDSCGISRGAVYLEESHYIAVVAEQQAQDALRHLTTDDRKAIAVFYAMRYGKRTRTELLEIRAAIDALLNLLPDPTSVLQSSS